MWTIEVIMY